VAIAAAPPSTTNVLGRHAGHDREREQQERGGADRPRLAGELSAEVVAERAIAGRRHARHEQARRDRDEQRRDLRDQARADRQQRVRLHRLGRRHAAADADREPADEVDDDDHDRGDRVAFDEAHRAVHRAVQLRFALEIGAAAARGIGVDRARAHLGVDRELLAGHRVEREPRRDLGDALGAARDDDQLHDRDHREHDEPDHEIAGDHRAAERAHDRACVCVGEHEPRRRDFEADAEQRRDDQQHRERREAERPRREQRRHEQRDGDADVEREQDVEQRPRQRHDQHDDHRDRERGDRELRPARAAERRLGWLRHVPSTSSISDGSSSIASPSTLSVGPPRWRTSDRWIWLRIMRSTLSSSSGGSLSRPRRSSSVDLTS
jgi:hypothetical protein